MSPPSGLRSVVATWLVSAVFGQLSWGHVRVILWCCLRAGRSTTPLGSNDCKKAQLVDIAEHYKIAVVGSKRKDEIKTVIVSSLFEQGVLQKSEFGAAGVVPVVVQTAGLTFEQQKELLAMQFEQEKLRLEEDKLELRLEQEELRLEQEKLELRGQQQEVEEPRPSETERRENVNTQSSGH
ncbi:hypothetical protein NQZ68_022327 [Dissostichus eleginoides]|nr:hypothetical protein NQZ68_022327 [Dissostichus eleginoides]